MSRYKRYRRYRKPKNKEPNNLKEIKNTERDFSREQNYLMNEELYNAGVPTPKKLRDKEASAAEGNYNDNIKVDDWLSNLDDTDAYIANLNSEYDSNQHDRQKDKARFKGYKRVIKQLQQGMPPSASWLPKKPRKKQIKLATAQVNKLYPRNENFAPLQKGYKWVNTTGTGTQSLYDFNNVDIFTNFIGNFFLRKINNTFTCWIQVVQTHEINSNGQVIKTITPSANKICQATYVDKPGDKTFPLCGIGAYFAKQNIDEDLTTHPHIYNDITMGCSEVEYKHILNGGNSPAHPHVIAHAGQTVIIDTAKMKVYTTDGQDLTKYTSFGSTFPPLYGNQINNINFYPTPGIGCDLDVTYVPRIK